MQCELDLALIFRSHLGTARLPRQNPVLVAGIENLRCECQLPGLSSILKANVYAGCYGVRAVIRYGIPGHTAGLA